MTTIRDSIPTEQIIRAYMDESEEQEEEVIIEEIDKNENESKNNEPVEKEQIPVTESTNEKPVVPSIVNTDNEPVVTTLSFNDYDTVQDGNTGTVENISAPKDIDTLEEISTSRAIQRKLEEEQDEMEDRIKIHTDSLTLGDLDVLDIDKQSTPFSGDQLVLDDVEVLA